MRYVKAGTEHSCSVCKKIIFEGEVCIQSQSRYDLFYHEGCHTERFGDSAIHAPNNEKPEVD